MVVYKLDSNAIFLRCHDKAKLDLYELDAAVSSSSIVKGTDWKHLASLEANLQYDALEIFGVQINGLAFKNLGEELYNLHVIVNREGFCYLNVSRIVDPSVDLVYYRLNDLFGWSKYGVKPKILSIWNRSDIVNGGAIVDLEDQYNALNKLKEDLKKKDQELELYKEEISALQIELDKCHKRGSKKSLPPPPPPPIRFYVLQSPLSSQFDITWILRKFTAVDEDVTGLFPRNDSPVTSVLLMVYTESSRYTFIVRPSPWVDQLRHLINN
ncbi:conserved hypothetical protein [Ricinus communis]|uniref:Uncharacterized protein n=1 Tax=Ricinus communis TaxID=3988 RepID=B9RUE9_RICCO|nr:conserved hypothetical protein [Ricinus communis]